MSELTPMMRQYLEIKADYPDAILFFRLGDFYEMFMDDAVQASRILDIALTSRNKNADGPGIPLCGIPSPPRRTTISTPSAARRTTGSQRPEPHPEEKAIVAAAPELAEYVAA